MVDELIFLKSCKQSGILEILSAAISRFNHYPKNLSLYAMVQEPAVSIWQPIIHCTICMFVPHQTFCVILFLVN